jgi:hypothetical protein
MKIVQDKVKARQRELVSRDGNGLLKIYKIIEYLKTQVYPTIERAGLQGVSTYDTNSGLLCEYLRKHYLKRVVTEGGYKDEDDPKLWDAVNAISLDEVSREISFIDVDAQTTMRILK